MCSHKIFVKLSILDLQTLDITCKLSHPIVGLSVDEVKKLRLEGISPIPREMAFPLMKTHDWHDHYQFIKYVELRRVFRSKQI